MMPFTVELGEGTSAGMYCDMSSREPFLLLERNNSKEDVVLVISNACWKSLVSQIEYITSILVQFANERRTIPVIHHLNGEWLVLVHQDQQGAIFVSLTKNREAIICQCRKRKSPHICLGIHEWLSLVDYLTSTRPETTKTTLPVKTESTSL